MIVYAKDHSNKKQNLNHKPDLKSNSRWWQILVDLLCLQVENMSHL